jgi:hypothetical protein
METAERTPATSGSTNSSHNDDGNSNVNTNIPEPKQPVAAISASLGFANGLEDWTFAESGGTEGGKATVLAQNGTAVLREGDSFTATLSHTFVVPEGATHLSFTYAELSFDTQAGGRIKDAFEAALVDSNDGTLVHVFVSGRDTFFNITEGESIALGSDASVSGRTVTLDIRGLFPNTPATLVFRLVNNDGDTNTLVRITDVRIESEAADSPPLVTIGLENDTAPTGAGSEAYRTDLLTNDPTIIGDATDDTKLTRLEVQVNDGAIQEVTPSVIDGRYRFTPTGLQPGLHRIKVRAIDSAG